MKIKFLIYTIIFFLIFDFKLALSDACILDTNGDGVGDGTAGAIAGNNSMQMACGEMAQAGGVPSMAIGSKSIASKSSSTAVGVEAQATATWSTALGYLARARSASSIAIGWDAVTTGGSSVAIGSNANAYGFRSAVIGGVASAANYSASLGFGAGADARASVAVGNNSDVNSASAIAIGYYAKVSRRADGAIAIGGDFDDDLNGAKVTAPFAIALGSSSEATAEGAIAIGSNVVADTANTMQVGVPIRIERGDGTSQLRVTETSTGTNVRTLLSLVCDRCTPGFRFNRKFPNNQSWFFRMLQNGDFSMDDPLTIAKEAKFKSGGDLIIGGTLTQASSRDIKTNFHELDSNEILNKIDQLPITQWSYKKDKGRINHIGPMAEDFYQLFNVGLNNKGISSVDTAGVALAAIKALNTQNIIKHKEISELQKQLDSQSRELVELKAMIAKLIHKDSGYESAVATY